MTPVVLLAFSLSTPGSSSVVSNFLSVSFQPLQPPAWPALCFPLSQQYVHILQTHREDDLDPSRIVSLSLLWTPELCVRASLYCGHAASYNVISGFQFISKLQGWAHISS